MATVTKDTLIGDILDMDRDTAPYFLEMGMHCLGCPSARGESLEEACMVHGVDVNELIENIWQINKSFHDSVNNRPSRFCRAVI